MRHLDIRRLLAEEEKLNCTFLSVAPHLGFLDPQAYHHPHLNAQTKVLLPAWLAESFFSMKERSKVIEVELPQHLNSKMREAIRAGPLAINFRSFSFHFFEVGLMLARMVNNEHLVELRIAFCGDRYQKLIDMALFE